MADDDARSILKKHFSYLKQGDESTKLYSLEKALASVITVQRPVMPVSVVVTVEDTSLSFLSEIIPFIKKEKIPVTFIVTPSRIDRLPDSERSETWRLLKSISNDPAVNFAITSYDYVTLPALPEAEIKRQIASARARFHEMMGFNAAYFTYPYGAYTANLQSLVKQQGFVAAFGMQGGAVSALSNTYALPRFPITDGYDDINRLQTIIETLPFPATDIQPDTSYLTTNPPVIGFSVPNAWMKKMQNLKCYGQEMGELTMTPLGQGRIEIRFSDAFENERTRINCTWPEVDAEKTTRWRWLGFLFVKNDAAPAASSETTGQPALLP